MNYLNILTKRRSIYNLNNTLPIKTDQLKEMIEAIVLQSPSAFNMQSSRVIVLLDDEHQKLWKIVTDTLKKRVPPNKFLSTQNKMDMFKRAKGTILFFDDLQVIEQLKSTYPSYKDQFDRFVEHGMGILQGNVWNSLAEIEIGASLQHYNPLIDEEVLKQWKLPVHYQLKAQMVFGGINEIPEAVEKIKIKKRVQFFQ